jgi:hypothetical protein
MMIGLGAVLSFGWMVSAAASAACQSNSAVHPLAVSLSLQLYYLSSLPHAR